MDQHVPWKGNNITRIAMRWTPEGKQSRGVPKNNLAQNCRKGTIRELNYSWSTIEELDKDRQRWKDFVAI